MKLGNQIDLKVKYSTKFLVEKLTEHLYNHVKDYKKAMKLYEDDMKDALQKLGSEAMIQMVSPDANFDLSKTRSLYNEVFAVKKPIDASNAYKQYIELLKMNVTDFLELDIADANSIINDEWDWAINAKLTNSAYTSR